MAKPKYQPGQTFYWLTEDNEVFIKVILGRVGKHYGRYCWLSNSVGPLDYSIDDSTATELAKYLNDYTNTEIEVRLRIMPYTVDSLIREHAIKCKCDLEKYCKRIGRICHTDKQRIALLEAEIKRRTEV